MPATLAEIGEFELIARLNRKFKIPPNVIGPGDDCAAVKEESGLHRLYTTDSMVDGVHFGKHLSTAQDIGFKLIASTVSDIAAMGAKTESILVSLQLPKTLEVSWVEALYEGVLEFTKEYEISLLGGNITQASEISLQATAIGSMSGPPILRSGAAAGEDLWVSGSIGAAVMGLKLLLQDSNTPPSLTERYQRPRPQLELGQILSKRRLATACIDISDGLFQDSLHLCRMSDVDLELDLSQVPLAKETLMAVSSIEAMTGGGDYELLWTSPQSNRELIQNLPNQFPTIGNVSKIGLVKPAEGHVDRISVLFEGEQLALSQYLINSGWTGEIGYSHFRL